MELYTTKFIYTALGVISLFTVLPLGINLAKNHSYIKKEKNEK